MFTSSSLSVNSTYNSSSEGMELKSDKFRDPACDSDSFKWFLKTIRLVS